MKKIPTLFERVFEGHQKVGILPNVRAGMEWVLEGDGIATVKIDGSCCAVFDGIFYKRYDAKQGKTPPAGAIPCSEPDPITGHHPHWLAVDRNKPDDKWFCAAFDNSDGANLEDGTYEAIGPHFASNPYNLEEDKLVRHGTQIIEVERSFEGIRDYLTKNCIEGIVFWKDGEPMCKIKRSDFGLKWKQYIH